MLPSSVVLFFICFGIFVGLMLVFLCLATFVPYGAMMWYLFPILLFSCLVLGGLATLIGLIIRHFFNDINVILLAIISNICLIAICGLLSLANTKISKNKESFIDIVSDESISEQEKLKLLKRKYNRSLGTGNSLINAKNGYSHLTPLHIAAENGELEIVEFLLAHGADAKASSEEGPVLGKAIKGGNPEIVKLILERNPDVNEVYYYRRTPLSDATYGNNPEIIKLLLEHGADVNQQDSDGVTVLQGILGYNEKEEASKLIYSAGGRLGKILPNTQTDPLMDHACSYGFTEVVDQLLKAGVKPTPHHVIQAAQKGQTEVLKQLMATGLDINQPDENGSYPFLYPVSLGHLDTVKFFVEHGADLTLEEVTPEGKYIGPALILAALNGDLPMTKYLLEQKADINIQNSYGETPLMLAVAKGYTDLALFLIEQGANVNIQKKVGTTALKFAAGKGNVTLINALVKAWAIIDLGDKDNDTPLIEACFMGQKDAAEALLKAGAKTNIKNLEGKTALDYAKEKGYTEIVELLKSYGAKE